MKWIFWTRWSLNLEFITSLAFIVYTFTFHLTFLCLWCSRLVMTWMKILAWQSWRRSGLREKLALTLAAIMGWSLSILVFVSWSSCSSFNVTVLWSLFLFHFPVKAIFLCVFLLFPIYCCAKPCRRMWNLLSLCVFIMVSVPKNV